MAGSRKLFSNEDPDVGPAPFARALRWLATRRPPKFEPSASTPKKYPADPPPPGDVRVFFVGHCTLIIEMGGLRFLTDPIFSDKASPFGLFGQPRYHPPGITLEDLPKIDAVLISHNHYDHLDEETIKRLPPGLKYFVPEGLAPWFRERGVADVTELSWWQVAKMNGVKIVAVPCQHWSRRTPFDTCRSHWCGFVLESGPVRFLFIGDSGYGPHFKKIGDMLGPFHIAALPIGAYDPAWMMAQVHMNPEEAVQAFEDTRASILVPTHYGCFQLADEPPGEPPRRLFHEWRAKGHDLDHLWMLAPGQHRCLEDIVYIPTVRATTTRIRRTEEDRQPKTDDPINRNRFAEWSIAICPHKGDMVDVEAVGHRDSLFEGDQGRTLTLDYVACSSHGEILECSTHHCPLRDPAFLRAYGLHGTRKEDGSIEAFAEIDTPPESKWWKEKLKLERKED